MKKGDNKKILLVIIIILVLAAGVYIGWAIKNKSILMSPSGGNILSEQQVQLMFANYNLIPAGEIKTSYSADGKKISERLYTLQLKEGGSEVPRISRTKSTKCIGSCSAGCQEIGCEPNGLGSCTSISCSGQGCSSGSCTAIYEIKN